MILDVVDTGPMYMSMLLFPIFIIFLFITIGRFNAYKKNKNKLTYWVPVSIVFTSIIESDILCICGLFLGAL